MSETLPYASVPSDESIIEGSHRDVTSIAVKAHSSKVAWWAASQRLGETIQLVDALDKLDRQTFFQCFESWGAVTQLVVPKEKKLQLRRMKPRTVMSHVYREGLLNQADWSIIADLSPQVTRAWKLDGVERTDLADVRRDFVAKVLEPLQIYTVVLSVGLRDKCFRRVSWKHTMMLCLVECLSWPVFLRSQWLRCLQHWLVRPATTSLPWGWRTPWSACRS
jgi:hypothetical protein